MAAQSARHELHLREATVDLFDFSLEFAREHVFALGGIHEFPERLNAAGVAPLVVGHTHGRAELYTSIAERDDLQVHGRGVDARHVTRSPGGRDDGREAHGVDVVRPVVLGRPFEGRTAGKERRNALEVVGIDFEFAVVGKVALVGALQEEFRRRDVARHGRDRERRRTKNARFGFAHGFGSRGTLFRPRRTGRHALHAARRLRGLSANRLPDGARAETEHPHSEEGPSENVILHHKYSASGLTASSLNALAPRRVCPSLPFSRTKPAFGEKAFFVKTAPLWGRSAASRPERKAKDFGEDDIIRVALR